jgi:FixJ family two-component response regulator
MSLIRILLVEDDPQLRHSLTRLLEASGHEVHAYGSAEGLLGDNVMLTAHAAPTCVVMDVNLTGMSGVEAQKSLRQVCQDLPIIFISAELNATHVNRAWREGAVDFLFKPFSPEELLAVIDKATQHGFAKSTPEETATAAQIIQKLTFRQLQVLFGLIEGRSNTQIAGKIGISARTVKMHREALMQRLGLRHLADLVRFYEQHKSLFPQTQGHP